MAYKKTRKMSIGKKMTCSGFGKRGSARGMYSGGFTMWIYGLKGIIGLEIYECWGSYNE